MIEKNESGGRNQNIDPREKDYRHESYRRFLYSRMKSNITMVVVVISLFQFRLR